MYIWALHGKHYHLLFIRGTKAACDYQYMYIY